MKILGKIYPLISNSEINTIAGSEPRYQACESTHFPVCFLFYLTVLLECLTVLSESINLSDTIQ